MMTREKVVRFRVNDEEDELVKLVAKKLDKHPSDAMRLLVIQAAKSLGIIPGEKGLPVYQVITRSEYNFRELDY